MAIPVTPSVAIVETPVTAKSLVVESPVTPSVPIVETPVAAKSLVVESPVTPNVLAVEIPIFKCDKLERPTTSKSASVVSLLFSTSDAVINTLFVVESVPVLTTQPSVAIAITPSNKLPSPLNCVALIIPVSEKQVIDVPTLKLPPTVETPEAYRVFVSVNSLTFTIPCTSKCWVGTVVPIPTRPAGVITKLSLST